MPLKILIIEPKDCLFMQMKDLKDYRKVSLKEQDIDGKLDFEQIFGRTGPVHIEIGSGKGTYLVSQAPAQPDINFLGIEWANKYYRYAVDRIGRWGYNNVRIIRTDAAAFLAEHVPDNSIDCFHIYFPDPWPKKKHNKRRFFNEDNMIQMLRCLKDEGIINVATDHADYYQQIQQVVTQAVSESKVEVIDFIRPAGAADGETVGTNYERKYIKEGRKTYPIAVRKN